MTESHSQGWENLGKGLNYELHQRFVHALLSAVFFFRSHWSEVLRNEIFSQYISHSSCVLLEIRESDGSLIVFYLTIFMILELARGGNYMNMYVNTWSFIYSLRPISFYRLPDALYRGVSRPTSQVLSIRFSSGTNCRRACQPELYFLLWTSILCAISGLYWFVEVNRIAKCAWHYNSASQLVLRLKSTAD